MCAIIRAIIGAQIAGIDCRAIGAGVPFTLCFLPAAKAIQFRASQVRNGAFMQGEFIDFLFHFVCFYLCSDTGSAAATNTLCARIGAIGGAVSDAGAAIRCRTLGAGIPLPFCFFASLKAIHF